MIRTHFIPCSIPRPQADALNRESGRIYTGVMVEHWRVFRQTGHWLSPGAQERLSDYLTSDDTSLLHAHSKDAAQQAFAKAAKTTRALRKQGIDAQFPRHRKQYRTTIWKNTGIRVRYGTLSDNGSGTLLLARARGLSPVQVMLPDTLNRLALLSNAAFLEARLVYERVSGRYSWHLVVEDGSHIPDPPGIATVGVDMGEIHPAVCTDGVSTLVVSCRQLRSLRQYTQKRGARLRSLQDTKSKGSRRHRRLKQRDSRFRAQQKCRIRDLEHKISREVVKYAVESKANVIAIGDVRDITDKADKGHVHNQRVSTWAHGRIRAYITYKAAYGGIRVELVDEHHTTKSCTRCRHLNKPRGRVYTCQSCGYGGHRDAVGAANILSRYLYREVSRVPSTEPKYRYPHQVWRKRSRLGTAQVAWEGQPAQEAIGLMNINGLIR